MSGHVESSVVGALARLGTRPGDVVVLSDPDDAMLGDRDTAMLLADVAKRLDVLFLVVPAGGTIEVADEATMARVGWVRADGAPRHVEPADPEPAVPA